MSTSETRAREDGKASLSVVETEKITVADFIAPMPPATNGEPSHNSPTRSYSNPITWVERGPEEAPKLHLDPDVTIIFPDAEAIPAPDTPNAPEVVAMVESSENDAVTLVLMDGEMLDIHSSYLDKGKGVECYGCDHDRTLGGHHSEGSYKPKAMADPEYIPDDRLREAFEQQKIHIESLQKQLRVTKPKGEHRKPQNQEKDWERRQEAKFDSEMLRARIESLGDQVDLLEKQKKDLQDQVESLEKQNEDLSRPLPLDSIYTLLHTLEKQPRTVFDTIKRHPRTFAQFQAYVERHIEYIAYLQYRVPNSSKRRRASKDEAVREKVVEYGPPATLASKDDNAGISGTCASCGSQAMNPEREGKKGSAEVTRAEGTDVEYLGHSRGATSLSKEIESLASPTLDNKAQFDRSCPLVETAVTRDTTTTVCGNNQNSNEMCTEDVSGTSSAIERSISSISCHKSEDKEPTELRIPRKFRKSRQTHELMGIPPRPAAHVKRFKDRTSTNNETLIESTTTRNEQSNTDQNGIVIAGGEISEEQQVASLTPAETTQEVELLKNGSSLLASIPEVVIAVTKPADEYQGTKTPSETLEIDIEGTFEGSIVAVECAEDQPQAEDRDEDSEIDGSESGITAAHDHIENTMSSAPAPEKARKNPLSSRQRLYYFSIGMIAGFLLLGALMWLRSTSSITNPFGYLKQRVQASPTTAPQSVISDLLGWTHGSEDPASASSVSSLSFCPVPSFLHRYMHPPRVISRPMISGQQVVSDLLGWTPRSMCPDALSINQEHLSSPAPAVMYLRIHSGYPSAGGSGIPISIPTTYDFRDWLMTGLRGLHIGVFMTTMLRSVAGS